MNADRRLAAREAGAATVMAIAWIFVITTFAWVAMLVAAATARQHRVDGAADLVAVSAASRLQRGGDACQLAEVIAQRNQVTLRACRVEGSDVVVAVTDDLRFPFDIRRTLGADARAGPAGS